MLIRLRLERSYKIINAKIQNKINIKQHLLYNNENYILIKFELLLNDTHKKCHKILSLFCKLHNTKKVFTCPIPSIKQLKCYIANTQKPLTIGDKYPKWS